MKQTVIITGGTKGLGREISCSFGRAGFYVIALFSQDDVAAREWDTLFASEKLHGRSVKHNITNENDLIWNSPEILEAEHVVLIHNACPPFAPTAMHLLPWEDFNDQWMVAVKGAWCCSRPLVRLMVKKKRGTIVNVLTSAIGPAAPKGFSNYVTAKHALRGFTLALAAEYSALGIKVLSVSPGFMDTSLTRGWDGRIRDSVKQTARVTVPKLAAERILELVTQNTPGLGEDYEI